MLWCTYNVILPLCICQSLSSTKFKVQLRLMGMSVLQVFSHKPKYWTNWNFDQMMALDEKLNDTVHPEGTMNVFTIFHSNPFKSCQDISLKAKNVNLIVELEEKSEKSPKLLRVILLDPWMSVQNFITIHPVAVEIFQRRPDEVLDQPTNIFIPANSCFFFPQL